MFTYGRHRRRIKRGRHRVKTRPTPLLGLIRGRRLRCLAARQLEGRRNALHRRASVCMPSVANTGVRRSFGVFCLRLSATGRTAAYDVGADISCYYRNVFSVDCVTHPWIQHITFAAETNTADTHTARQCDAERHSTFAC